LQFNVFAQHSEVLFLGWPSPTPELSNAVRSITYEDSETYGGQAVAAELQRFLASHYVSKTISVLSHENFVLYEATDRGVVASRIADLFPNARILFTGQKAAGCSVRLVSAEGAQVP